MGLDMTRKFHRIGNIRPRPIANTRVESMYGKNENVVENGTEKGVSAQRETRKRPTGCLRSTGWDVHEERPILPKESNRLSTGNKAGLRGSLFAIEFD